MIDPSQVSAVLVTRGNVELAEILEQLEADGIEDVVVWNNAERDRDLACFGRYAGIAEARNEYIFHQDDDLVSPVGRLLEHYDPIRDRYGLVSNNRIDEEWPLTAIGTVFHRELARDCFDAYIDAYGFDEDFCRVCDVVFAYQHPIRRVVLGYRDLPWASDPQSSMYLQPDHMTVRFRARARVFDLIREPQP
jgi:hypothetical protein